MKAVNFTCDTVDVCPGKVYKTFRFLRSQIFAVWSSLPVNLQHVTDFMRL